jgi:signal transduction histidine kinase/ligand-binding sensor domain-containing protein
MPAGSQFPPAARRRAPAAVAGAALLLLLLRGGAVAAPRFDAPGEFLVSSWHTEDGLPDGNVTAIEQTPEGYLWLGTFKGLARFDGVRFTAMDIQRGSKLPDARIGALRTDRGGRLWLGFASGHLAWLEDGRCKWVDGAGLPDNTPALLAPEWSAGTEHSTHSRLLRTVSLVEDADGAMWFHAGGEAVLRVKAGKASLLTPTNGLPATNLRGLLRDATGVLWLLTGRGLFHRTGDAWSQAPLALGASEELVVSPAAEGGLVISTGRRVQRFRGGALSGGFDPTPGAPGSQRAQVTALLEDGSGRLWAGTHWSGLLVADEAGHWQRPRQEGPLAQCRVLTLFADRQGAVWAGTLGDGLFRLTPRAVTTVRLPAPAEGHLVITVCAARDGSVWAGTDGVGAFRVLAGGVEHCGTNEGLPGQVVFSILEDRQTNLWFGTSAGLYRRAAGQFERVQDFPTRAEGVLAQFEARDGTHWFSSPAGPVQGRDGHLTLHRLGEGSVEIRAFAQDHAGGIWVGTIGQGLFCLRSNRVEHYGPAQGLTHPDARSLCVDATGALWVGTLGGGLFRFAEGRFNAITTADGLPDDTINGILADVDDNLWMSSYNGFFGCARELLAGYERGASSPLVFRRLSPAEGLDYRTCSGAGQPVVSCSPDGRLWFANQRSLAVCEPQVLLSRATTPSVLVEALAADGVELPLAGAPRVRASSATRRFEFRYTALNLARPEQARFRHRLHGLEEEWADAGAQRVAAYSHLAPGQYDFEVMAAGPDGVWRNAAATGLEVVPRFTERSIVRVLAACGLVGTAVGLAFVVSRARMRRRLLMLEMKQATERERRRIAHDLHDDLGGSLTEISLLAGSVPLHAPEQGVLAEVRQKADGLVNALDEIVWAVNPRHDSAASLAEYLAGHARDFLRAADIRLRVELPRELPAIALTPEQRHGLFLAAKEALNNAVRHGRPKEVHLRLAVESGVLKIAVVDDGCGFDPARLPSSGNGLPGMRERLERLGGRAEIRSAPGQGTAVELKLPWA